MRRQSTFTLVLVLLAVCLAVVLNVASAAEQSRTPRTVQGTTGTPIRTYLDINNISTVITAIGIADIDIQEQNSGLVFPKGSRKTAMFESGFLWGGKINGQVRVGGSAYRTGLTTGKINNGVAESPDLAKNRIYRVRPDWKTGSLASEAADLGVDQGAVRAQYEKDWNEWPAADGAPYKDVDSNGTYDPTIDIPGFPGADQTIWYVANDHDAQLVQQLYGTLPMGLELQVTMWAYSQQGALGNMFFKKFILINKGTNRVDSMYVSQWADPDLGNSTDDFAGCDTSLSLGYVYNANASDATYAPLPPPAVGFDFFQGPVVPGAPADSATFGGKIVHGKKNLPMTSFYYFARGDPAVTDPTQGDPAGALQFYNFFRGRIGLTGQPFVDPNTNRQTPFALAGDPQTRSGWIDGQLLPAGDRRIGLASGPFTMAPGDTQEVVVAEIAAGAIQGVDRLSAIGLLKFYDQQAQLAYNNFFNLPVPPPAPNVTATELDKEILLSWGNDLAAVKATEQSNAKGYAFEGYNVYQLPSAAATISEGRRVATYDLVNGVGKIKDYFFDPTVGDVLITDKQFGNDVGIQRYIDIKNDELTGGGPLVNGKRYYFAVTSYSYNPTPGVVPNNLENPLAILTVTPHSQAPGFSFSATPVSYQNVTHTQGIGDATVFYKVVDPTKLTGANYAVGFSATPDKFSANLLLDPLNDGDTTAIGLVDFKGSLILDVTGTKVTYDFTLTNTDSLQGGAIASAGFVNSAGTVVKTVTFTTATVLGKKVGTATGSWTLTSALKDSLVGEKLALRIVPTGASYGTFDVPIMISSYPWYLTKNGQTVLDYQENYSLDSAYQIVDGLQVVVGNLTFAAPTTYTSATLTTDAAPAGDTSLAFGGDGTAFGFATGRAFEFYGGGGGATQTDLVQDLEFRFTGVPENPADPRNSKVVSGGSIATVRSRSSASATHRIRIPFEVWEVERNRQINCVIVDRNAGGGSPWGDTGTPEYYRIAGREYTVPVATPYNPDTAMSVATSVITRSSPEATWIVFFEPTSKWHTGDVFKVKYANNIIPGTTASSDMYAFTAPAPKSYSTAQAVKDVEKISVFPNPYYGVNTQEINKYQRFVTFSHLPTNATIRIFNLAGVMVRTIAKNDVSTFMRWDLANENGLPVASGMYIAHIDMPDLGTSKIVKFSIIQERQILDRF